MRRGHRSNVFAVLLDAPCLEGFRRLEAEYGEDFRADTPTRAFVYDVKAITADIARKAGITSEPEIAAGVVFRLTRWYEGRTEQELWKWLKRAEERDEEWAET